MPQRTQSNSYRFLLSLAEELHSQSNRVRDLIGDAHWLSDGHHKEYLLTHLLSRHLPLGVIASRGFVVSPTDPADRSTEQDVLLVDTQRESPLFNQGGLIISFPQSVLAAVSVKTKLRSSEVEDTIRGLNTVRSVANDHVEPREIWCAGYFFEPATADGCVASTVYRQIEDAVFKHPVRKRLIPAKYPLPCGPDLMCTAKDFAFSINHNYKSDDSAAASPCINGYSCKGLSTAFFLANLLSHIAAVRRGPQTDFSAFAQSFTLESLTPPHQLFASSGH
jgi:hypothetical protein